MHWVTAIRSPVLTPFAYALTLLGYRTLLIVLLTLMYWMRRPSNSAWLLVSFLLCVVVNSYLKDLFEDPRPDPSLRLDAGVGKSFGFPSGHAQIAVLLWGWLAYAARGRPSAAAFVAIGTGVALSRLYLGVHDVGDVLGGALIGFAFLLPGLYVARRWQGNTDILSACAFGCAACIGILWLLWPNGHQSSSAPLLVGIAAGFGLGTRLWGSPRFPVNAGGLIRAGVALLVFFALLAVADIGKVNEILGKNGALFGTGLLAGAYYVMAPMLGTRVLDTRADA